jgi:hypothetical protein
MKFIRIWILIIWLPVLSPGKNSGASHKTGDPMSIEGSRHLRGPAYRGRSKIDSLPFASFFDHEAKPAASVPCFPGAYYRKILSSEDQWLGVEGTVVLPKIVFDSARKNPARPGQYLDNPSVYMGGNMNGQETDIGLSWSVTKDADGKVSTDRNAFRPFFRRSEHEGQQPVWINAPASPQYYWYPGEEVRMSLRVVSKGKVRLIVSGANKRYEAVFDCAGYVPGGTGAFKRVDAIDQVGNEGKSVQPTKTRVLGAIWKETNLYRSDKKHVVLVPFGENRYTDMRCPDPRFFDIRSTAAQRSRGAEEINISGSGF